LLRYTYGLDGFELRQYRGNKNVAPPYLPR